MHWKSFAKYLAYLFIVSVWLVSCNPPNPNPNPGVTNPSWKRADLIGLTKVSLEWTTVPNIDSYTLERKEGSGSYSNIFSGKATIREDSVTEGQTYTYRVKSVKGGVSSTGVEKTVTVPTRGTPQALTTLTNAEAWFSKVATNGNPSTSTNAPTNITKSGTDLIMNGVGEALYYLGGNCSIFNATVSGAGFKVFADEKQLWPASGAASSGSTGDLAVAGKQSLSLVFQGTGQGTWTKPTIYCSSAITSPSESYLKGKWGAVFDWGTGTATAEYPYGKLVPTHAANLPDGTIATWAAWKETTYGNKPDETPSFQNRTAGFLWNPSNSSFTPTNNPSHDMFCAGLAVMPDGDVFAAGGGSLGTASGVDSQRRTSYFDSVTKTWAEVGSSSNLPFEVEHWYPTAVAMPDSRVLVVGGSGASDLYTSAEIRGPNQTDPWTNSASSVIAMFPRETDINIPNGNTAIFNNNTLTANAAEWLEVQGWYPYLNVAPDGQLFQSGPIPRLYKYNVNGTTITGTANADVPNGVAQMRTWGNSIMYDEGKILVTGGSVVRGAGATNTGFTIDINGGAISPEAVPPMRFRRAHQNSVVLPTGDVLMIGGNNSGKQFTDGSGFTCPKRKWANANNNDLDDCSEAASGSFSGDANANNRWPTDIDTESALTPELFSPDKRAWRDLADMSVPRNYHSIGILLQDGRVLAAGGGLCGDLNGVVTRVPCNHPNGQIFEPPYLFNPDGSPGSRPVIGNLGAGASTNGDGYPSIGYGRQFSVTMSNLGDGTGISKFSMIKLSAVTHSINTDVRYLEYSVDKGNLAGSGSSYQLTTTNNENVLTPGYYFLFAINDKGVPSVAKVIQIQAN